jgi:hypothetical protein
MPRLASPPLPLPRAGITGEGHGTGEPNTLLGPGQGEAMWPNRYPVFIFLALAPALRPTGGLP